MPMINKFFGKNRKKKQLQEVNEAFVFDKAKYHMESALEDGLTEVHAFVQTGLFVAWVIKNDLYSDFLKDEGKDKIEQIKKENIAPCEMYIYLDGVLAGEFLNKLGYNFTADYFEFDNGDYLDDYEKAVGHKYTSSYGVENTWKNYHKIAKVLDRRFAAYKKTINLAY